MRRPPQRPAPPRNSFAQFRFRLTSLFYTSRSSRFRTSLHIVDGTLSTVPTHPYWGRVSLVSIDSFRGTSDSPKRCRFVSCDVLKFFNKDLHPGRTSPGLQHPQLKQLYATLPSTVKFSDHPGVDYFLVFLGRSFWRIIPSSGQ